MAALRFSQSYPGRVFLDLPRLAEVGKALLDFGSNLPADELLITINEELKFKGFDEFQAFALQFPQEIVTPSKVDLKVSWFSRSGSGPSEHTFIALVIQPDDVWLYFTADDPHLFYSVRDRIIDLAKSLKTKSIFAFTKMRIFALQIIVMSLVLIFNIVAMVTKQYSLSYLLGATSVILGLMTIPINTVFHKLLMGKPIKLVVMPDVKRISDTK